MYYMVWLYVGNGSIGMMRKIPSHSSIDFLISNDKDFLQVI